MYSSKSLKIALLLVWSFQGLTQPGRCAELGERSIQKETPTVSIVALALDLTSPSSASGLSSRCSHTPKATAHRGWWPRAGAWSLTSLVDLTLCLPFGKEIGVETKARVKGAMKGQLQRSEAAPDSGWSARSGEAS